MTEHCSSKKSIFYTYSLIPLTQIDPCSTLAASIGMFVWGESIGWSSVVNPLLRKPESGFGIGDDESSWIGSTISIGGFIGGLMAGQTSSWF